MTLSPPFVLADVPTVASVERLRATLLHESNEGLVSRLRHHHRARVLRQQEALLASATRN